MQESSAAHGKSCTLAGAGRRGRCDAIATSSHGKGFQRGKALGRRRLPHHRPHRGPRRKRMYPNPAPASPPHPAALPAGVWRILFGPVATLLVAALLLWLDTLGIHVPNPVLLLVNAIVLSAFLGGLWAGLASVAVTFGFALLYWCAPQPPWHYTARDINRLLVLGLTMPPLALLVGWLRAALNRNHQALLDQYEALTAELRHRTALEERQRDVDHILRHDLKSPLTGLISIPQMLLDDGNLKPEHREMLTLVATAGRKMLGQINSSLELRKIEDGTYTLQAEPCDPVKLVRDNFGMLTVGGYARSISLHLVEKAPITLRTDGKLLDIVLANLLRNALEASDPGNAVVVALAAQNGECTIAITNNRPVPQEVREHFFEKYTTAGKSGGTGLGTYSAQLMTRALGGTITMETGEQTGTTVTVRLPLDGKEANGQ